MFGQKTKPISSHKSIITKNNPPLAENSNNDVLVSANPNLKKSNAVGFFTGLFKKRLLSAAELDESVIEIEGKETLPPEEDEIVVEINVEEKKNPKRYEQKSSEAVEKAAEKITRISDVLMVGDLHGNYEAYVESLKRLEATDETGNWIGGNKKLILLGDIIVDRNPHGLKILEDLRILKNQAQKAGGEVILIAGNHEDFAWRFLTAKDSDPIFETCLNAEQGEGLLEFITEFSSNLQLKECKTLLEVDEVMIKTDILGRYISNKMRKSPEGKDVLEQMCSFKLVDKIDDTLFLHTELTPLILETLKKYGKDVEESINKINDIYKRGLKSTLLEEGTTPDDFNMIKNAFLNTDNRHYRNGQGDLKWLHENGINRIIHGHSDLYKLYGKNIYPTYDDVDIVGIDNSAGKSRGIEPGTTLSIGIIEKEKGKLTTSLEALETK